MAIKTTFTEKGDITEVLSNPKPADIPASPETLPSESSALQTSGSPLKTPVLPTPDSVNSNLEFLTANQEIEDSEEADLKKARDYLNSLNDSKKEYFVVLLPKPGASYGSFASAAKGGCVMGLPSSMFGSLNPPSPITYPEAEAARDRATVLGYQAHIIQSRSIYLGEEEFRAMTLKMAREAKSKHGYQAILSNSEDVPSPKDAQSIQNLENPSKDQKP